MSTEVGAPAEPTGPLLPGWYRAPADAYPEDWPPGYLDDDPDEPYRPVTIVDDKEGASERDRHPGRS